MSFCCLCGRSDDRSREFLILDHSFRHFYSADCALSCLILSPCVTGKVSADNHFNLERLAFMTYSYHRIRNCDLPVGENVSCSIKEFCCNLVEYLSLEWDTLREHDVKCRDAV